MYSADKYKNKAVRAHPNQARGKERVRVILSAALDLFKEYGVEQVTTNDIAERAQVPIGSLYRYYPNKDSIISALVALYVDDVSAIFKNIGKHPMLKYLSWDEVLILMVDGWVSYSRLNGPFTFFYAVWANPRLYEQSKSDRKRLVAAFAAVIKKRCPSVQERQVLVCFSLCMAAVRMGSNEDSRQIAGDDAFHEAVSAVAAYMLRVCGPSAQEDSDILA